MRHVRITPHSHLPKERLKAFSRFKYVLVADVSRFYELVDTHTLPWAINGKDAAKADNDWKSTRSLREQARFPDPPSPVAPDPGNSRWARQLRYRWRDSAFGGG